MDFTLTELQEMLRTSARDFLKTYCPPKFVKEMAKDEKGYTDALWQQMSEMGWMGLVVPETYGGAGGSYQDLIVLIEEMGRVCLPGPFLSTVVYGELALLAAGSEEQKTEFLPKLAEGKLRMTLAFLEKDIKYTADGIQLKAIKKGDEFILQGTKLFVPDAHVCEYIIVAARTKDTEKPEDGVTLFLIDAKSQGITINLLDTIAGEKQCEVIFENVSVPAEAVIGDLDESWIVLENIIEKAAIAQCSLAIGSARQLMDITLDYAKQRKTWGHVIGSYQVIQHNFANIIVDIDGCYLMVNNAAWRLSEGLPADREVYMAKALTNEGFRRVASLCFQIHGAIAFSEDSDVPLYYKRAKAWDINLGSTHYYLDKIASFENV